LRNHPESKSFTDVFGSITLIFKGTPSGAGGELTQARTCAAGVWQCRRTVRPIKKPTNRLKWGKCSLYRGFVSFMAKTRQKNEILMVRNEVRFRNKGLEPIDLESGKWSLNWEIEGFSSC
jgi:hypothetical protein